MAVIAHVNTAEASGKLRRKAAAFSTNSDHRPLDACVRSRNGRVTIALDWGRSLVGLTPLENGLYPLLNLNFCAENHSPQCKVDLQRVGHVFSPRFRFAT